MMAPARFHGYWQHSLLMGSLCLLAACSQLKPSTVEPPAAGLTEAVLEPPAQVPKSLLEAPATDLLALTPGMRKFINSYFVDDDASTVDKLDRLYELMRYNSEFQVTYDASATRTAAEVFATRRGNCLAFSAMVIALARELDIPAQFQEVETPPTWDAVNDDTLVQYRHINVAVPLGRRRQAVIDLRSDLYSSTYPQQIVSDATGLAHYYSNLSMDYLVADELGRAWVAAKRGIEADPERAFIWNNMGIIQRRLGNLALAEASYRQALTLDPYDWSALSNLALLMARRGDTEEADKLRQQAEDYKLRNPYYRFALAQQAYRKGDYQEALDQLNVAVRRRSQEHRFYFLRGLSFWELGDSQAAIRDVKRAIEIGEQDSFAANDYLADYQQRLEGWLDNNG